jgi:hypothetical protein
VWDTHTHTEESEGRMSVNAPHTQYAIEVKEGGGGGTGEDAS